MNLRKLMRGVAAAIAVSCGGVSVAAVEPGDVPIITFHTTIYDQADVENVFHIVLGATENTYVDVDFGYGPIEEEITQAVYNPDTQEVEGTFISCSVSKAGLVKIYGDPKLIDYVYMEGCYIDEISFPQLTEVSILNLEHNNLKALDVSHMTKLQALYLSDNPFDESPLIVGKSKPDLAILEMSMIGDLDSAFDITGYPNLVSLAAYSVPSLHRLDPTKCPQLMRISVDATSIQSIDVTKNSKLLILNVSNTDVTNVDLSHNKYLTEFYCSNSGTFKSATKFTELDVSKNPELQRLFCGGNNLKELNLSNNPKLTDLSAAYNNLTALNLDNNTDIYNIDISRNNMDFATLPAPKSSYSEYYYAQKPLPVARSYKEGDVLDFSARVLRSNTLTTAKLFSFNRANPSTMAEMSSEYYTYADGKVTLLKACADSLYVEFYNTMFMEAPLATTNFMVKTEADYGKPSPAVKIGFSAAATTVEMSVGIADASEDSPVSFFVDFGGGTLTEFKATSSVLPATANVTGRRGGATTTVYIPEGHDLTAFGVSKGRIASSDFTQAPALKELVINGTSMSSIDLRWNNLLTSLNLDNNSLTSLDLSGGNARYEKNFLTNISAANNKMTFVTLNDHAMIRSLNLSNNLLSEIMLDRAFNLEEMNVSNNRLAAIDLNDCMALTTLDCSHNRLSSLPVPYYCPLTYLDITYNDITFANLAPIGSYSTYLYAPQSPVQLPTKAPSVDLRSYLFTDDAGQTTSFVWRTVDGDKLVSDKQISADNGFFKFIDTEMGEVYCTMSHPAFPAFTGADIYKTTNILAAELPTNVFASFTPSAAGRVNLTMAGKTNGTVVYIDWKGNGNLEQYILSSIYKVYSAAVEKDVEVKCYSYDDDDNVTVFSIDNARVSRLDMSKMKQLICLSWSGGDLANADVAYPATATLKEFTLSDNGLTQIPDLSKYTNLEMLNVSNNKLESIDITAVPSLKLLFAGANAIKDVKLNNPSLWNLSLAGNQLQEIDLSGAPALTQLALGSNRLTEVNLESLKGLRVVYLSNNDMTIATLPLPRDNWTIYDYGNQNPVEVKGEDLHIVDLSSQLSRDGVLTEYRWFVGSPWFDENGVLTGEELYIDEEYDIEGGVTTFKIDLDGLMCVMTNPLFPSLYLYTYLIDVRAASLDEIMAEDAGRNVEYFDLFGIRVDTPSHGIYLRRQGDKVSKIFIK